MITGFAPFNVTRGIGNEARGKRMAHDREMASHARLERQEGVHTRCMGKSVGRLYDSAVLRQKFGHALLL